MGFPLKLTLEGFPTTKSQSESPENKIYFADYILDHFL